MERVLLTLKGEETDRVPVCSLAVGVSRGVTGVGFPQFSRDSQAAAESMILANQIVGDDVILCFTDLSVEAADFGQEMVYPEHSTAHPNYERALIKEPQDYLTLQSFSPASGERMGAYLDLCSILVNRVGHHTPVLGFVYGPLGVLGMMRGMEGLYRDIVDHPEEVKVALEVITTVLEAFVLEQFHRGVAGVCIDTLPASRSGVSPSQWEAFEGVYVKRISDVINRCGILNAHHGCGFSPYFKEVKKWIDPSVYSFADVPEDCRNFEEAKRRYGKEATLMGCVSTELLYSGSPAEVIRQCVEQIDLLGRNGRFILAPTCEFPPNGNLLNARAMVIAAEMAASGTMDTSWVGAA